MARAWPELLLGARTGRRARAGRRLRGARLGTGWCQLLCPQRCRPLTVPAGLPLHGAPELVASHAAQLPCAASAPP